MTLSALEFLLLFGILGMLSGAFVFLFRGLVQSRDDRIKELVVERDYYRSAAVFERGLPAELHPSALPPGTAITVAAPTTAKDDKKTDGGMNRFAAYSLLIQAVISVVVIVISFFLIVTPTEPTANQVAYQLISFITGTWLGRGVDYASKK